MKSKYLDALIVFGIIFSILAVIFYIAALFMAEMSVFVIGVMFQVIGAILIGVFKKEGKKNKTQDAADLARLTRENKQFDNDKSLV